VSAIARESGYLVQLNTQRRTFSDVARRDHRTYSREYLRGSPTEVLLSTKFVLIGVLGLGIGLSGCDGAETITPIQSGGAWSTTFGNPSAGCATSVGGVPQSGGTTSTSGVMSSGGSSTIPSLGGAPRTGGATSTSTPAVNCSGPALTGGTQHCSSNAQGTVNGVGWSIWSSGSGGCMTTYGAGAAFKATWNNSGDFLARMGFQWDETKTYDQYGTISADYAYTKSGTGGGYSFIGIYGWSNNPLVEFYIVDDWFGNRPPTGGGTLKGTFTVDGETYNVYTHTQTSQPSIHGTATFPQFFSIRQTARQCGHISVTEHFKQWASYGMNLGKMYEAKLLVEAGGGTGSIDYTSASMTTK